MIFAITLVECSASQAFLMINTSQKIDSLIALERTFLSHLKTGIALATTSVVVSQSYILSHSTATRETDFQITSGPRQIGKALSILLLFWAMVTTLIGAVRFLRMQDTLVKGDMKIAGGWEVHIEGVGVLVVCLDMNRPSWIIYSV